MDKPIDPADVEWSATGPFVEYTHLNDQALAMSGIWVDGPCPVCVLTETHRHVNSVVVETYAQVEARRSGA